MTIVPNNLILELHVPDFGKVREFYGLLGFSELSYDPTSGGGSDLGYLILKRDDPLGETHLNFYGDKPKVSEHSYFNQFPADTQKGYAVEITVPVADVDKLWNEVSPLLSPEQIGQPLRLKRWGKKDFRVIDPFGFYVRFTELVDWDNSKPSS